MTRKVEQLRLRPSPCRIGDLQPRGVLLPEVRRQRPRPADGDLSRRHSALLAKARRRLTDFAPSDPLSRKISRNPSIEYRTADLYRNDVQDRIDLTDIGYPDESIDIFICSHMFEHIPDDRKAMRELCRILKPGGFGLVLVPLAVGVDETHEDPAIDSDEVRWKYFGMGDHVRQYGKRDFVERLAAAGFVVDQLGVEYFGRETFRRAGIADNSVLYVVRKDGAAGSAAPAVQHADVPLVPADAATRPGAIKRNDRFGRRIGPSRKTVLRRSPRQFFEWGLSSTGP